MPLIIKEVETEEGIFIEANITLNDLVILSWHVKIETREGESFEDARARAIRIARAVPTIEEIEAAEAEEGPYGPN